MKILFLFLTIMVLLFSCSTPLKIRPTKGRLKVKEKEYPIKILLTKKLSERERAIELYRLMRENPDNYELYKKHMMKLRDMKVKRGQYLPVKKVKSRVVEPHKKAKAKQSDIKSIARESEQRLSYYCFTKNAIARHRGDGPCKIFTERLKKGCLEKEELSISNGRAFSYLYCIKSGLY